MHVLVLAGKKYERDIAILMQKGGGPPPRIFESTVLGTRLTDNLWAAWLFSRRRGRTRLRRVGSDS